MDDTKKNAYTRVIATGSALPEKAVSNDSLAAQLALKGVQTSDEWISSRTGIRSRYIAEPGLTVLELARRASLRALESGGIDPASIDLIIVATTTADCVFPSTACALQAALGIKGCAAFDVQAVCSGFVYGMSVTDGLIRTGGYRRALVVGSEIFSRIVDWTDRTTCVLFGDGAGAIVLEASAEPGILSHRMHADGTFGHDTLSLAARIEQGAIHGHPFVRMNGRQVFRLAVESLTDSALEVCAMAGIRPEDVDVWVPHQANVRIIEMIAKKLGFAADRTVITVDHHGNTSAASVPLALDEAVRSGRIGPGDTVLLQGVGAGMTWGSVLLKW
ncbi:MAG: ketoacyl-ACP synthase III [Duodenibacillus sp.]|nr:ketoacyl-ACP synthase III [Duodenibacillus sp.]